MSKIETVIVNCPFCKAPFQMSHSVFDGKNLKRYHMTVCDTCYWDNADGWAPEFEALLLASLKEHGLPTPERNANGLLPCS